jgi:hypothetical protein
MNICSWGNFTSIPSIINPSYSDYEPEHAECMVCFTRILKDNKIYCDMCMMKIKKKCVLGAEEINKWKIFIVDVRTQKVVHHGPLIFGDDLVTFNGGRDSNIVFEKHEFGQEKCRFKIITDKETIPFDFVYNGIFNYITTGSPNHNEIA